MEQGLGYNLPNLDAMKVKRGFEQDGKIVAAVMCRPTVEIYLVCDPSWQSPRWRYEVMKVLQDDVERQLWREGFTDAVLWIAPEKEKSFARRLKRCFGWIDVPLKCMMRANQCVSR